jgi:hypothetical protein
MTSSGRQPARLAKADVLSPTTSMLTLLASNGDEQTRQVSSPSQILFAQPAFERRQLSLAVCHARQERCWQQRTEAEAMAARCRKGTTAVGQSLLTAVAADRASHDSRTDVWMRRGISCSSWLAAAASRSVNISHADFIPVLSVNIQVYIAANSGAERRITSCGRTPSSQVVALVADKRARGRIRVAF